MDDQFTRQRIDHHVEVVRALIQPPLDPKEDRVHLQEFFNRVSERQPALYDSLAQEPGRFEIRKQLIMPGVGRLVVPTFFVTPQGPVLSFPRKLTITPDDVPWAADLNAEIIATLSTFFECHPGRLSLRLAKRRELIFTTGTTDSSEYLRARFASGVAPEAQDVVVQWARSDDKYERRVTLAAVQRRKVVRQNVDGIDVQREEPTPEFGIRLVVEVANRGAPQRLSGESYKIILDHADSFYNEVVANLRRTDDGPAA